MRYASAEDLAKTLTPFVQNGGRIAADAGRNALIISGDPSTQQVLNGLIDAFDVNTLAGQSYALLPVTSGDAKDFASAMQDGLRGAGSALASVVRVIPMARISSVLVVSGQPRYIDEARRIYGLVERKRRLTVRSWHVYYLQNSRSNDTAYVLQQAFTPNSVTAMPTPPSNGPGGGNYGAARGRHRQRRDRLIGGLERSAGHGCREPGRRLGWARVRVAWAVAGSALAPHQRARPVRRRRLRPGWRPATRYWAVWTPAAAAAKAAAPMRR